MSNEKYNIVMASLPKEIQDMINGKLTADKVQSLYEKYKDVYIDEEVLSLLEMEEILVKDLLSSLPKNFNDLPLEIQVQIYEQLSIEDLYKLYNNKLIDKNTISLIRIPKQILLKELKESALKGRFDIVKFIIKDTGLTDEDIYQYLLHDVAGEGHLNIFKYLFEEGLITIEDIRKNDSLILNFAAGEGHLDLVKYIIEDVGLTAEDIKISSSVGEAYINEFRKVGRYLKRMLKKLEKNA